MDAGDTSSIQETGGVVSQWNDKSGSGNHLTPNGSSDPMSGTATLNELNVIEFDGNDILTTDSLNDVNNSDQTWFIVARVDIGGVSNAGDGIIAYDQWAEGNWQIQASNTSQFRGRVRKIFRFVRKYLEFSNQDLSGAYRLFTLELDRTNQTMSSWLDGY